MMTITLYKGSKVDGVTRLGKWVTLADQSNYFDSLESYTEEVKTVRLGEPIRVSKKINELINYNYGHIDYGDGYRYYFAITNVEMNSENQTDINYMIDAYETLVKQTPFTFGRAIIMRHKSKIGKCLSPYAPTYVKQISARKANYTYATLFYIRRDDTNADRTMYGLIATKDNINAFFDGTWFDTFQVTGTPNQIVIANVMPCLTHDFKDQQLSLDVAIERNYDWYGEVDLEDLGIYNRIIKNNGITYDAFKDMRGLDIFVPEENNEYTITKAVIGANASNFKLILSMISASNERKYTTVALEGVMSFTDQWQEYNYRQRQIDIDTRNMNIEKSVIAGVASTAESVAMGAVLGPVGAGANAGAKTSGALAMGGGGLLSTAINTGLQIAYAGQEQELIDRQYKYANDSLTMVGDFSLAEYNSMRMGLYSFSTDASDNYEHDIEAMGYYCEAVVEDFNDYFVLGPVKAEVEILGVSVIGWREQIANRFRNGVKVV